MLRKGLIYLAWLGVALLSIYFFTHPPTQSSKALSGNAAVFERAVRHLEKVSAEIHPVSTTAHEAVKSHIASSLSASGLEVHNQIVLIDEVADRPRGGVLTNILARIEGSGNGKALLVTSHYDSGPASYGSADSGAAVASMLALAEHFSKTPLTNDVIFLFSDAEEIGLFGAKAFSQRHPWAADVGMVLNFEARGTSGPSMMFETSEGNGTIIKHFEEAAVRPVAGSLFYEIYKRLPNNTDFSIYKEAGMSGLNFAFIGDAQNYHTVNDNFDNLDRASFVHHFINMHSMIIQFGNADISDLKAENSTYFDFMSLFLVEYPSLWTWVLLVGCLLMYARIAVVNFTSISFTRILALGVGIIAAVALCGGILGYMASQGFWSAYVANGRYQEIKLALIVMLVFTVVLVPLSRMQRYVSYVETLLAIAAIWCTALCFIAVVALDSSYLFLWPVFFLLVANGLIEQLKKKGVDRFSWLILAIAPLPFIAIWSPLLYGIFLALSLRAIITIFCITAFFALMIKASLPYCSSGGGVRPSYLYN